MATGSGTSESPDDRSDEDDIPEVLSVDDFVMKETLGTGTFARVRLVQLKSTGRYYALKILKKAVVVRLNQVVHTCAERTLLASVRHPFVINLLRTFQDDEKLYMLFDYVPGGEIFSHLRRAGRFPLHVSRFYAAELVLALEYLHSRGIAYRDLKPENLLIGVDGHLKISDFGFAKVVTDRTYTLCGTPEYLAPEIIVSKGHSHAVDWWALGILIYEMMAGFPPYYADDPNNHQATYEKILQSKLTFPRHFSRSARDILRRLLEPDPNRRMGSTEGGTATIRAHSFFRDINWRALEGKEVRPPIVPKLSKPSDTHYFDSFPEDEDDESGTDIPTAPGQSQRDLEEMLRSQPNISHDVFSEF